MELPIAKTPAADISSSCMRRHPGNICRRAAAGGSEDVCPCAGSEPVWAHVAILASKQNIDSSLAIDP